MKALKFFLFLCILTINSIAQDILQDTLKLVIVSQKVGTLIDRTERDQYHMMSSVNNFVSASFYITDSGKFYSRIESSDDSGTTIMTLQEYPEAVLFRLAEKINNYEDIMDRSYLIGQEPVTVYVVGGDPITWEPKVSMQIVSNKAQTSNLNESTGSERGVEFDSIGISAYKKSEVHITYGYGIGKGAPPSSSYDETVVYDSYSTRQIANVKDIYFRVNNYLNWYDDPTYYK
ncbi:MAG: hypothetical protein HYV29_15185 [Ignavibacteriales bacterium]|nr:hypothetical protein [Ignavibacteriales bacterium]